MKVAICFAGLPYYIKQNQRYWQETIDKYNADVYASLWDEENICQDGDTIKSFQEAYKPKELEVDNQEAFNRSFASVGQEYSDSPSFFTQAEHMSHVNGRVYAYFYKIWRANLMASTKGYDVVVRAETCSSFPNLEIVDQPSLSLPYWLHMSNLGNYNTASLNSWVAFGPPYIMDYYCSMFLKLRKYYNECLLHPVEGMINYHLMHRPNLWLRLFFNKIYRKAVLNWDGGKYKDPLFMTVGQIFDEKHYKHNTQFDNGFDTSINTQVKKVVAQNPSCKHTEIRDIVRRKLDLHTMRDFTDLNKPSEQKGSEKERHKANRYCPIKKAHEDFKKPYIDKDGNWGPKKVDVS